MASQAGTIGVKDVTSKTTSLRHLANSFKAALATARTEQIVVAATSNPLDALRDASTVLKAQITKLGLLLINKPLTPSAIHTILADIESRVLPALFTSAADIFGRKATFGHSFTSEVVDLLRSALSTFDPMMTTVDSVVIDTTAPALTKEQVLAVVGQVFSACDDVANLIALGVVGLLLRKVKAQVQLIEDAIAELTEWGEEVDLDAGEDGEVSITEDEDAQSERELQQRQQQQAPRSLEDMTAALALQSSWNGQMPGNRTDLVELVPEATRRADLSVKLCQAMSKRRMRKFKFDAPPVKDAEHEILQIKFVDSCEQIILHITHIQDDMDEVAAAFYDLDAMQVKHQLRSLSQHAKSISNLVTNTWDGHEDEFTLWLQTWTRLFEKRDFMIAANDA